MDVQETLQLLESGESRQLMEKLYGKGQAEAGISRYQKLIKGYEAIFGNEEIALFTSPGRTEISGNHTDHNHGKVLAGSINLDCVGDRKSVV